MAAAFEHQRLAVAADVGEELDAAGVPHQHLGVVHPGERVVIAHLRHHQLVADVVRPRAEQARLLLGEHAGVEVPRYRELAGGRLQLARVEQVGHRAPEWRKNGAHSTPGKV